MTLETRLGLPASQAWILQAIIDGKADWDWCETDLEVDDLPDERLVIRVLRQSLRVPDPKTGKMAIPPISARLQQLICDALGGILPTPLIVDKVYNHCRVKIQPITNVDGGIAATSNWLRYNELIEYQLDKLRAVMKIDGQIVRCLGKTWALGNKIPTDGSRAMNYGYHGAAGRYRSVDGKSKLWQQPGTAHNVDHFDPSQAPEVVDGWCEHYDGSTRTTWRTSEVYQHERLSRFVSHEGPLKFVRQPGVARFEQLVVVPTVTIEA